MKSEKKNIWNGSAVAADQKMNFKKITHNQKQRKSKTNIDNDLAGVSISRSTLGLLGTYAAYMLIAQWWSDQCYCVHISYVFDTKLIQNKHEFVANASLGHRTMVTRVPEEYNSQAHWTIFIHSQCMEEEQIDTERPTLREGGNDEA